MPFLTFLPFFAENKEKYGIYTFQNLTYDTASIMRWNSDLSALSGEVELLLFGRSMQDPMIYYMGATGGVLKTTDAGEGWKNISRLASFNICFCWGDHSSEYDPKCYLCPAWAKLPFVAVDEFSWRWSI